MTLLGLTSRWVTRGRGRGGESVGDLDGEFSGPRRVPHSFLRDDLIESLACDVLHRR